MFRFRVTKTIKFKKTMEVDKDIFAKIYIKADCNGLTFFYKIPKPIQDPYFAVATFPTSEFYFFKDQGFKRTCFIVSGKNMLDKESYQYDNEKFLKEFY